MTIRNYLVFVVAWVWVCSLMGLELFASRLQNGESLFDEHCAPCHFSNVIPRALAVETMRTFEPEEIVAALTDGAMREQGEGLSTFERIAIAEFVTGRAVGLGSDSNTGLCSVSDQWQGLDSHPQWNGWGADVTNRRYQSALQARLEISDVSRLELKWAFGFPDATSAWAQPTVVGGRLFLGDQNGKVYALDAKTGCMHWMFEAQSGVRSSITVTRLDDGREVLFFGDLNANVYSLDARSGERLWTIDVEKHEGARITGAPVVYSDQIFVPVSSAEESLALDAEYACCTFRGSLVSLDIATGELAWKTYVISEQPRPRGRNPDGAFLMGPAGAAIWSAPTVDVERGAVYVGTGNDYTELPSATSDAVVAFDLETGAIRWWQQMTANDSFIHGCHQRNANCPKEVGGDFDFGASPALVRGKDGRDLLIIGQKSGVGYALDPDDGGNIVWQLRLDSGSELGGVEWGFAVDDTQVYFGNAAFLASEPGGVAAVQVATGELVWFTGPGPAVCDGCNSHMRAAVTAIPGVVFVGAHDGMFRAYAAEDGTTIWQFDTNGDYKTVNGVVAKGGSLNGPGAVVVDGMVYTPSGYASFGGRPGNVLLAFGVD